MLTSAILAFVLLLGLAPLDVGSGGPSALTVTPTVTPYDVGSGGPSGH